MHTILHTYKAVCTLVIHSKHSPYCFNLVYHKILVYVILKCNQVRYI